MSQYRRDRTRLNAERQPLRCSTWTSPAGRPQSGCGWTPASLHWSASDTREPVWSSLGQRDVPGARGARRSPGDAAAAASDETARTQTHTRSMLASTSGDTFTRSVGNRSVLSLFSLALVHFIIAVTVRREPAKSWMTGYKSKGRGSQLAQSACKCVSHRLYLPATMIWGMVEGGDAVEEAGQFFLCRVSLSTLQECKSVNNKQEAFFLMWLFLI